MFKALEINKVLTVKLTGKVFDDDPSMLEKHVETYRELISKGYKIILVAGGGRVARKYIELAEKLGVESNYWLDELGINAARLNALLLIPLLQPHVYPKVIKYLDEVPVALKNSNIVVMGGLIPGQSTAAVAVEAAEATGSKLLIDFTVVDKVYDKDPSKYPDAKPIDEINATDLLRILSSQESKPGKYELIDRRALEIAVRSRIKIIVLSYKYPEKIHNVLRGENPGTIIYPR